MNSLSAETWAWIIFITIVGICFHVKFNEKAIAYGPAILTTLGICATFLGISLGLYHFDVNNIEQSLPNLLSGLRTVFWASFAGVFGALTIKFRYYLSSSHKKSSDIDYPIPHPQDLAPLLQGIQKALTGNEETSLVSQLKLLRQDFKDSSKEIKDSFKTELGAFRAENNNNLHKLEMAQNEAIKKLSEMGSKSLIEALQNVIQDFNHKLTEQFGENFKELNNAVGKLLDWQENYKNHIEQMTQTYQAICQSTETATQSYQQLVDKSEVFTQVAGDLSGLLTALESQKNTLIRTLESLGTLLTRASSSLPEIENKVMELTDQLSRAVQENQKTINQSLSENTALHKVAIEKVGEDLNQTTHSLQEKLAHVVAEISRQIVDSTQNTTRNLESAISKVGEQMNSATSGFIDSSSAQQREVHQAVTESIKQMRTATEEVGRDLTQLNQEFKGFIENTRTQVATLDKALSEELTRSLNSLGQQLTSLSEKFARDYSPLTEELRKVVQLANHR
ncbi:hypothetical conserved protein [Candidatus Nitrosoglobus terrae]|uniref:Hypothetical conserved protein n=1 Tax=Candidatus Nitrosoglobus terrae TaxID=1630141 RepID=A0A1Q2SNK9_9GAMM|nr:hypothetical protein [Candidatus Nitrosoglobus terrae]BAW80710.1 hypothetical conserved protein [Candidatus Nitrosoglobus terrae]